MSVLKWWVLVVVLLCVVCIKYNRFLYLYVTETLFDTLQHRSQDG